MTEDFPKPESVDHLIAILSSFTDYEKMAAFHSGAVRCGLETMERLAAALGDPQHAVRSVHVTGSKGKGSTAIMISALLEAAGLTCGLYTSPHLVDLRERIAVDRSPIDDAPFLAAAEEVLSLLRDDGTLRPTFFEFMTAASMVAFRDADLDVAIYEVGLGGRLDATNVVLPAVSIVTSIELEHVPRLGTTRMAIAAEKAGIIKRCVPVLTALEADDPARRVLEERAAAMAAPLHGPGAGLEIGLSGDRCLARFLGGEPALFVPPPPASIQARNGALALAAADIVLNGPEKDERIEPAAGILSGLALPGRFEVFSGRGGCRIILDSAHSPASLAAVAREARRLAGADPLVALFGLARDKDVAAALAPLVEQADHLVFVSYDSPRSLPPGEIRAAAGGRGRTASSVADGLAEARRLAGGSGTVLVTGSVYCAGEARALLDAGS